MLNVRYESKFKKDFKAVVKRGYDISLLEETIDLLRNQTPLPAYTLSTNADRNGLRFLLCKIQTTTRTTEQPKFKEEKNNGTKKLGIFGN